jgi:hypothetical protein
VTYFFIGAASAGAFMWGMLNNDHHLYVYGMGLAAIACAIMERK